MCCRRSQRAVGIDKDENAGVDWQRERAALWILKVRCAEPLFKYCIANKGWAETRMSNQVRYRALLLHWDTIHLLSYIISAISLTISFSTLKAILHCSK